MLLTILKERFDQNPVIGDVKWEEIVEVIESNPTLKQAIQYLQETKGEPQLVYFEEDQAYYYVDMSDETPDRRNLCYDRAALNARKQAKPQSDVWTECQRHHVELLTQAQYEWLQTMKKMDQKTSSWIWTPEPIRALGGALFCDRRYDHVFVYHNGAQSYYASRGFRARVKVLSSI